jgi:hypothetical protein
MVAGAIYESPSSSGLGHRPFKAAARVRTPLGTQDQTRSDKAGVATIQPARAWLYRQGRARDARISSLRAAGTAAARSAGPEEPDYLVNESQ